MFKLKNIGILGFVFILCLMFSSCNKDRNQLLIKSPDGKIEIQALESDGKLFYEVKKEGKTLVNHSQLGFILKEGNLFNNLKITTIQHASNDDTWDQIWGEETTVRNHYNEMKIGVEEQENALKFDVIFRAFDDGIGFRYVFPEQKNLGFFTILDEITEFNFANNHKSWSIHYNTPYYEGLYEQKLLNELDTVCTPLTMESEDGTYFCLHEANLTKYASLNVTPQQGTSKLKAYLSPWSTGEKVFMKTPGETPWRTLIITDSASDLLLSRIMLNLNEPCKIEDTSWITTGRYIGIWWGMHTRDYDWHIGPKHGATTANAMRYIDFAAKHNFQGVLIEGWNKGWDHMTLSFTESYPDFDLEKVAAYAKEKGVKLLGHHETAGNIDNYDKYMEEGFALYQKNGVNFVKTGYVAQKLNLYELHGSQYGVEHYRDVVETAAQYQIMIDNHEPVMPTGLQRTFPNLMTHEAVRGQEWDAWDTGGGNPPSHTTIIPFTRGLAGPMDFTPGTFKFENPILPNTRVWTTLAKQLALSVVIYSPWQMASDMIENYENNPAFEFITSCPTNWSKTVVPHAKIGEYLTIARKDRDSENWYIGSITNEEARNLSLSLDFLDANSTYKAKLFKDGENADYKTNPYPVSIEELEVDASTVIELNLATSGGTAIILTKME